MKIINCVAKCVEVFDELALQLKYLVKDVPPKPRKVQFVSPGGADLGVTQGEGDVKIGGKKYESWRPDTLNEIDIRPDFGKEGTHWLSDQLGSGKASDVALAAVLIHEASHSCYDDYSANFPNDWPSDEDKKAYHLGEVRSTTYEIWFLQSVLGDSSCAEDCLKPPNPPLTANERKALERRIKAVKAFRSFHRAKAAVL